MAMHIACQQWKYTAIKIKILAKSIGYIIFCFPARRTGRSTLATILTQSVDIGQFLSQVAPTR